MDKKKSIGGMLIPAGLLIGLGIGLATDKTAAGTIIGLGVGFVAAFLFGTYKKEK